MTDESTIFKAILSALPLKLEGKADPGVIEFSNWNVEEATRKIAEVFTPLREENRGLREALEKILNSDFGFKITDYQYHLLATESRRVAREALKGNKK